MTAAAPRLVKVDPVMLMALVRAAIGALDQRGASIDVPRVVDHRWLRRYITRLHSKGPARFRVQARSTVITVIRTNDPMPEETRHVEEHHQD